MERLAAMSCNPSIEPMLAEPIAVAFANTRSSANRDRIATLADWRAWIDAWPGLRPVGRRVDADGLIDLRRLRDDVQSVLHRVASGERDDTSAIDRIVRLADSQPRRGIHWSARRPVIAAAGGASPSAVMGQHLARATLDVVLNGPDLALCAGRECRKVFIATRADRRWCDSAVCGNRARVRAHANRRRTAREPRAE
jgi:predicted RNA-binding Zn ribbon-like protein